MFSSTLEWSDLHPMPKSESEPTQPPVTVRSNCPQCNARLAVLRIIAGRAGSEYWTMRCTKCGGIHLDIVNTVPSSCSI
jgi:DNA-directed RNA polymerase subunit M/transcription elongation factor TFIIS